MKKLLLLGILIIVCINLYRPNYNKEIQQVKSIKGYNTNFAILIDYGLSSGKDRMFLVDLKKSKIIKSFKVANGRGQKKYFNLFPNYSNIPNSNESSLGFSVIKAKGYSNWGVNFKYVLKGLDKTNSNIERRNVVLHSWDGIKDYWFYPLPLPQSKGCPTVSNRTMIYLDKILKKEKNILIYTFKK